MLDNKILETSARQAGFTLIELLIAVVLGLLITAAVTAMTVGSLKMNAGTLKSARLNQDLGAVMQIMINDIRRAGYAGDAPGYAVDEDINIVSSSCILYSYNRGEPETSIDDNELNGFKLDAGSMKMRTSCDVSTHANCYTSCLDAVGTWVQLTDPEIINITRFELNSENSKCYNIDDDISIRIEPGTSATELACNETTTANVQQGVVDGDGDWVWSDLSDSITLPLYDSSNPTLNVGVQHINISLEAELAKDSSVSKNLDVSIKLRNDHFYQ